MADEAFEALMEQANVTTEKPTEMVETPAETTPEPEATPQEPVSTEMEQTVEVDANEPVTQPEVNYNEWLKNETGGLFEDVETFKNSLQKFKDYDSKESQILELQKNQMPEDAFIKKLSEMRNAGASPSQINEFIKINTEYEDLTKLEPMEAKIAKMVLIDGYSKEVAQRKVENEFNLYGYDEDSIEYREKQEDLKISSKKDLEQLAEYQAKISKVENTEENKRLEGIALKSAHEEEVSKHIPNIVSDLKGGLGVMNLSGKVGEEDVALDFNFDYDEDFKSSLPQMASYFFNQSIEPITKEKVEEFKSYANAIYRDKIFDKSVKDAYLSGLAKGAEKAELKYVNNGGVKETVKEDVNKSTQLSAEWKAFEEKVANWR